MKDILLPYLLLSISGCISPDQLNAPSSYVGQNARTVCEIFSSPNDFVNKHVVLRATYLAQPHDRVLFDPDCGTGEVILRTSENGTNRHVRKIMQRALRKNPAARLKVIYEGTLTAEPMISGCAEAACFQYVLREASLLSVESNNDR